MQRKEDARDRIFRLILRAKCAHSTSVVIAMNTLTSKRTADYQPWLYASCIFALCWITALLFAGGFTTTIDAGMAFLDWPLSNGSLNPDDWIVESDMLAEHSHRLLGMIVGFLSLGILLFTWLREERSWMRTC